MFPVIAQEAPGGVVRPGQSGHNGDITFVNVTSTLTKLGNGPIQNLHPSPPLSALMLPEYCIVC